MRLKDLFPTSTEIVSSEIKEDSEPVEIAPAVIDEELIRFLKENLTVELSTRNDDGRQYIKVELLLQEHVISESEDWFIDLTAPRDY